MRFLIIIILAIFHGAIVSLLLGEFTNLDSFDKSVISGINWTILYLSYCIIRNKRERIIENKTIERKKEKEITNKRNEEIRNQTFIKLKQKEIDKINNESLVNVGQNKEKDSPIYNKNSMINLNLEKIE